MAKKPIAATLEMEEMRPTLKTTAAQTPKTTAAQALATTAAQTLVTTVARTQETGVALEPQNVERAMAHTVRR